MLWMEEKVSEEVRRDTMKYHEGRRTGARDAT